MDTQPQPAIPPFEQLSLPASINESGRRILWIVGIYRAVCGTLLVGTALFLDLRVAGINLPNAFVTTTGLYFIFGLLSFLWIQRESLHHSAARAVAGAARRRHLLHRAADVLRG